MKHSQFNLILRRNHPNWAGWKILDFYDSINIDINNSHEQKLILLLEENFYLVKKLETYC